MNIIPTRLVVHSLDVVYILNIVFFHSFSTTALLNSNPLHITLHYTSLRLLHFIQSQSWSSEKIKRNFYTFIRNEKNWMPQWLLIIFIFSAYMGIYYNNITVRLMCLNWNYRIPRCLLTDLSISLVLSDETVYKYVFMMCTLSLCNCMSFGFNWRL